MHLLRPAIVPVMLVALSGLGAVLGFSSNAGASNPSSTLTLAAYPTAHDPHQIELVANVRLSGAPSSGSTSAGDLVVYSVRLRQFTGSPLLSLGSSLTDVTGRATLLYQPTWTGNQLLVATVSNAAGAVFASTTDRFIASVATRPFAGAIQSTRPDGTLGRVVAGVLLVAVAAIWIALISIVVRVNLALSEDRSEKLRLPSPKRV